MFTDTGGLVVAGLPESLLDADMEYPTEIMDDDTAEYQIASWAPARSAGTAATGATNCRSISAASYFKVYVGSVGLAEPVSESPMNALSN